MKISIVVFPGSNCDRDMFTVARDMAGGRGSVRYVWHKDSTLPECDLIILPGGFSHGDYLRSGAMAAHAPILRAVKEHAAQGRLVLGVCNGFQILTEAGLLPGVLLRNRNLTFLCRDVFLRVEQAASPFTRSYREKQVICVPIAHHDGNYFADADTVKALEDGRRILFRYCSEGGALDDAANPNGSVAHIAGIVSEAGNVAGMMPHPERACDPLTGGVDGQAFFQGLLERAA